MNTHGSRNPVDSLTHADHKCVKLAHDYAQASLIRPGQEVATEQQEVVGHRLIQTQQDSCLAELLDFINTAAIIHNNAPTETLKK